MKQNMLTEAPQKAILHFSLPLFIGSVLQNLYNVFDTAIVGHMMGKEALAAVGNSYVPMLIINSVILGISSGISIQLSQLYGSQKNAKIKECIGSVQVLNVVIGIGLAILSFFSAKWIFAIMSIPESIAGLATSYWQIIAVGIPFLSIYNFYSAIIKAKGNSKVPIQGMGISCVVNILLDYLFVGTFHFGIHGAAIATVLSQVIAAGIIVIFLHHKDKETITVIPNYHQVWAILRLSITGVVQNGASAISMFFIQGLINQYGVNEISAYTSAYKIESMLTIPAVNLGTALSVFVGQNIGAKEIKRTQQGLKDSFKIAILFSVVAMLIMWVLSPVLMYLLVGNEKVVIEIGVQYLHIISLTFPLCVSLYLLTNFLRGTGEVAYPLFNTILELSVRSVSAIVLSNHIGFVGILLCRPISFIVSTVSLSCRYASQKWHPDNAVYHRQP